MPSRASVFTSVLCILLIFASVVHATCEGILTQSSGVDGAIDANPNLNSNLSAESTAEILLILEQALKPGKQLQEKDGLRNGFIDLVDGYLVARQKMAFFIALRAISFTDSDYLMLLQDDNAATSRLEQGWRIFLNAIDAPVKDEPITVANIRASLDHLSQIKGEKLSASSTRAVPLVSAAKDIAKPNEITEFAKDAPERLRWISNHVFMQLHQLHQVDLSQAQHLLNSYSGVVLRQVSLSGKELCSTILFHKGDQTDVSFIVEVDCQTKSNVISVLPHEKKAASLLLSAISRRMGMRREVVSLSWHGDKLDGPTGFIIDRSVQAKLLLKHRISLEDLSEITARSSEVRRRINLNSKISKEFEVELLPRGGRNQNTYILVFSKKTYEENLFLHTFYERR